MFEQIKCTCANASIVQPYRVSKNCKIRKKKTKKNKKRCLKLRSYYASDIIDHINEISRHRIDSNYHSNVVTEYNNMYYYSKVTTLRVVVVLTARKMDLIFILNTAM